MDSYSIDPRAPSCDATMTLSPIDKLLCPAGGEITRSEPGSPEHLLPVLNIIRHIYFIISLPLSPPLLLSITSIMAPRPLSD